MKTEFSKISLIFLFLVALIGTLLRSVVYIPIPFEYLNLIHAHSHTAFQGWVYLIMFLLLTNTYLSVSQIKNGHYRLQFKFTVFVVIGVLVSFSLQGYGLYSIIFSTLFQLLNYWFILVFFKSLKTDRAIEQKSIALRFIKTGLWYGLLSTILPYAIGVASAKGLNGTAIYNSLIYSFMHLQYNGWFLFVVLGLFFNYLDRKNIHYNGRNGFRFYRLFTISVIPAISLSLLGMEFSTYVLPIAYGSAVLLGLALIYFILTISPSIIRYVRQESVWFKFYFLSFLASLLLKLFLQCLSVFPFFENYAFYNKPIIIAYLHLSLIGSITFLFLALLIEKKWLVLNGRVKIGSALLLLGYALTESLLITTGLGLYQNQMILCIGSGAMAFGILMLIISGKP